MTVTVTEAIYRARTEGKESVDALARSVDGLSVSEEKLTRATRASEQGFERLQAKLDPAIRAQQQYERTIEQVSKYEAAGIGSAQQRAQMIALATQRYQEAKAALGGAAVANDNLGKSTGLAAWQVQNLGFQLNDIATGLVSGQSPFRVLAQQGGQVYQILGQGPGGIGGALKDIAGRLMGFLGPLGLVAVGLGAVATAGVAFYSILKTEAPTTQKLLEEHDRLLKVIKDSYDNVARSASRWVEQSRDVTILQALQQQVELQKKLNDETAKQLKGTLQLQFPGGMQAPEYVVKEKFKPFADAIFDLQQGWANGAPNVRAFVDEVARLALLQPALQSVAAELIKNFAAGEDSAAALQRATKQVQEILNIARTGVVPKDNQVGINVGSQVNAYDQLIQRTRDRIEELKEEANYAGQASSAVAVLKLQHDAERSAKQAGVPVNQKVIDQLKEELALAERQKAIANVRAGIEFDRKTLGLSQEDIQIAERLKPLYGNDIPAALASMEAAQIRNINRIHEMRDAAQGFAQTLLSGLMQGKSFMDSLGAAGSQMTQRLASAQMDRFMAGNFSSPGAGNLMSGQGAMGIAGAGLAGYQSASPLGGALGGAMAGFAVGGPVGAVIGGAAGLVGGLIGQSSKAKKEEEERIRRAKEAWDAAKDTAEIFKATMMGKDMGTLKPTIEEARKENDRLGNLAWAAGDAQGNFAIRMAFNEFVIRTQKDFVESWADTIAAFDAGQGPDSPFNRARSQIKDMGTALSNFVEDTIFVGQRGRSDGETLGAQLDIERARKSAQDYALSLLIPQEPLSALHEGFLRIKGEATELQKVLVKLGMSSDEAATAIAAKLTEAIAHLRTEFERDIVEKLNVAEGKGYINDLNDLIKATKGMFSDAQLVGADPALVGRYLAVQAQKIVDGADLVGDAFDDLLVDFPSLAGVISESTTAIKSQIEAQRQFRDELRKTIDEFVFGLETGSQSSLSPAAQFEAVQERFEDQLALAQTGDRDALSGITQLAQTYIEQARGFLGPSQSFGTISASVVAALKALPDIAALNDPSSQAIDGTLAAQRALQLLQSLAGGLQTGGIVGRFAPGGLVGNGLWNVDSVRARFAGGGDIMLAGGEFVNRATSVNTSTLPTLDFINRTGRLPAGGDNSEMVAEIRALRTENKMLMSAVARLLADGTAATAGVKQEVAGLRLDTRQAAQEARVRDKSAA